MLAYADDEALRLTADTGLAHFYSRSRARLWLKGSTSGGLLEVLHVLLDCDGDAAAYIAAPRRHVCHKGRRSCFHNTVADRRLQVLEKLLAETWPHTGTVHPLATWSPPPSPLLAALASRLLAEALRPKRPTAVLAPAQPPPVLAALTAEKLPAALHLAPEPGRAPESLGELDRVAVIAPDAETAEALARAAEERAAETVAAVAVQGPPPKGGCSLLELQGDKPVPGTCLRGGSSHGQG